MTLPNRQWDAYTAAELAALEDLAPNTLVWLLYGGAIDRLHKQQLDPYIAAHQPRLLYRPYADNIASLPANVWATICYKRILDVGHLGELIPGNELNVEGMGEDWPRQIAWLKAFYREWADTQMDDPCHLPALSPSGNYQAGFAAYAKAGLYALFPIADAHVYDREHAVPPARTLCVTEFNRVGLADLEPLGARDAVYFLLGGTADQAANDLLKQPSSYQSFKKWRPTMPNPTALDVGQGVKDAMAAHGDAPTTNEHYLTDAKGFTFKSETCGTKGKCEWWKETNRTVYIPFA